MKLLKNRAFAAFVLIAAIALSSLYGLSKKPVVEVPDGTAPLNTSINAGYVSPYVVDNAHVLSASTKNSICLYGANWDTWINGILSVVTLKNVEGSISDAAWDWAERLELGANDAIFILDVGGKDYFLLPSRTAFWMPVCTVMCRMGGMMRRCWHCWNSFMCLLPGLATRRTLSLAAAFLECSVLSRRSSRL